MPFAQARENSPKSPAFKSQVGGLHNYVLFPFSQVEIQKKKMK